VETLLIAGKEQQSRDVLEMMNRVRRVMRSTNRELLLAADRLKRLSQSAGESSHGMIFSLMGLVRELTEDFVGSGIGASDAGHNDFAEGPVDLVAVPSRDLGFSWKRAGGSTTGEKGL